MHFFNNKVLELLAPAGTFAILEKLVHDNCDALYFGGKQYNMRLHRKDYNLSDEELRRAVQLIHSHNKKAYITVNNLYTQQELPAVSEYLAFLAEIEPDALIVQDFSVLKLVRDLKLPVPIHASVMMNVYNAATLQVLRDYRVSRVVMSREIPLSSIKILSASSDMEFEYFVHGDMCVCHGGQCLYSSFLFGKSANQGQCLKPCRWAYTIEYQGQQIRTSFPLAVKDMYLYECIPELVHNNIMAFKIEGRMRDYEYLSGIVHAYGDALDRYTEDPIAYNRHREAEYLYEQRKRDFSTGYAFGKPGLANINSRLEGTGAFYSSGKPFSLATEEPESTQALVQELRAYLAGEPVKEHNPPALELAVKVNNRAQAELCLRKKIHSLYLSGEVYKPNPPFSLTAVKELCRLKGTSKLFMALPRMTFDQDIEEWSVFLSQCAGLDGLVITNAGALRALAPVVRLLREHTQDFRLIGDYSLNILNLQAWTFFQEEGLSGFTISLEAKMDALLALLNGAGSCAELLVFGNPAVMYLEHNLFDHIGEDRRAKSMLYLVDEKGFRHPVYYDRNNRNHILLYKTLNLKPLLKDLRRHGLCRCRIEAAILSLEELDSVLDSFLAAPDTPLPGEGFTLGPLSFSETARR